VPPVELPDVSALPRLTEALLRRKVDEGAIQKILGGNVLRVLKDVPARAYRETRADRNEPV
jgi:microsomal dipeptidase-like Zn-dependent dipeptidase